MRKYFLAILLLAILPGCEKDFDEIIDVNKVNYQVTSLNTFTSFRYVVGDSVITIFLNINSPEGISEVFCSIIASDGSMLNSNPVLLRDNGNAANGDVTEGDNKFTALFPLSRFNPVGTHTIIYFITDNEGNTKQVALHQFYYDNGQTNVAPVISNLVLADTISRGVSFIFTITASDANGLNDIEFVYFELYRPDGTVVEESAGNTKFLMHDDGNSDVFGDETSGDGIYSYKNSFLDDPSTQTGSWRFEFQANDRGGLISNIVEKTIVVE